MIDLSQYPTACPLEWEIVERAGSFAEGVPSPKADWVGRMTWWDYHKLRALRSSELRTAAEYSLLMVKSDRDNPDDAKESDEQIRGRALHALLLEPETTWKKYARAPDWLVNRARKKDKDHWAEMVKEYGAPYVLRATDYDGINAQAERILSKPKLRVLLHDGDSELTLVWKEEVEVPGHGDVGVWCKARIDWLTVLPGRGPTIVDLKGSADARPHKFMYSVRDYRYDLQGSHYTTGAARLGIMAKDYAILASEWRRPYDCRLYRLRERTHLLAEIQRDQLLKRFALAQVTGDWPGYADEVETIGLPFGAEKDLEAEVRALEERR